MEDYDLSYPSDIKFYEKLMSIGKGSFSNVKNITN